MRHSKKQFVPFLYFSISVIESEKYLTCTVYLLASAAADHSFFSYCANEILICIPALVLVIGGAVEIFGSTLLCSK